MAIDSKKLDEALLTVRVAVSEIASLKKQADSFVKERQEAASKLDLLILEKQAALNELDAKVKAAEENANNRLAQIAEALKGAQVVIGR